MEQWWWRKIVDRAVVSEVLNNCRISDFPLPPLQWVLQCCSAAVLQCCCWWMLPTKRIWTERRIFSSFVAAGTGPSGQDWWLCHIFPQPQLQFGLGHGQTYFLLGLHSRHFLICHCGQHVLVRQLPCWLSSFLCWLYICWVHPKVSISIKS